MSKTILEYGDYVAGAKEAFAPSASEAEFPESVSEISENVAFPNYANPIELYSTPLDDTALGLGEEPTMVGWWSEQISDENGNFENLIVLTMIADGLYTAKGVYLEFDTYTGVFPKSAEAIWYRDEEEISRGTFEIANTTAFLSNYVEFFDKIIIEFTALNMPYSRLKVHSVDYGRKFIAEGDDLKNVNISQKFNAISAEIPISTIDFTIAPKQETDFYFSERQPAKIFKGEELQATVFVKKANRISQNVWRVQAEDYISFLENTSFNGGIYSNKNARDLLLEISQICKVPFEIEESLSDETVTGHIALGTCRNALMQILFAIGAVAITAKSDNVKICRLKEEQTQFVDKSRIMQGQTIVEETRVTAVSVTSHKYVQSDNLLTAYKAEESGAGENLFVNFSEPLHTLSITNGTILESGANYAIINASVGCVLNGKKYEHLTNVKTKHNPLVLAIDSANVKSVPNATLVSDDKVDSVLERCYNYYVNKRMIESKIVEGDIPSVIGDKIALATEYSGDVEGVIISQDYSLSGTGIVKRTSVRCV